MNPQPLEFVDFLSVRVSFSLAGCPCLHGGCAWFVLFIFCSCFLLFVSVCLCLSSPPSHLPSSRCYRPNLSCPLTDPCHCSPCSCHTRRPSSIIPEGCRGLFGVHAIHQADVACTCGCSWRKSYLPSLLQQGGNEQVRFLLLKFYNGLFYCVLCMVNQGRDSPMPNTIVILK